MEKFFNFNNEQALTPIDVDSATGEVTFELDGETTTFNSVQEFAEFYADARNVKADNLKNWSLIEDGDIYSFVLRAGSAGIDERDLASTARALRDSGMSPEEVARTMINIQAEEREKEEREQTRLRSEREGMIDGLIDSIVDTNREKLLFLAYDVANTDELKEAIELDASLFETDDDIDEYDEYDEAYDEYDEYDAEYIQYENENETFNNNIRNKIREQEREIEEAFPNVPLSIALSIIFVEAIDEAYREGAVEAFNKAKRVASVAGRNVPVTIVDCADTEAPVVTSTFHNKEGVDVLDGMLCVYKRRFITLKNFNPDLPRDDEFKDIETEDVDALDE